MIDVTTIGREFSGNIDDVGQMYMTCDRIINRYKAFRDCLDVALERELLV